MNPCPTTTSEGGDFLRENPAAGEELLPPILDTCLRRLDCWSVPPNWSAKAWRQEVRQIAALVGLQALHDYDASVGGLLESFIAQRVTSGVRTSYRREWAYPSRFPSREARFQVPSELTLAEGDDSDIDEPVSEPIVLYQELHEAISALSASHQGVVLELFLNGYTETEVGATLQLSQCAVNKRKQAALSSLREYLQRAA